MSIERRLAPRYAYDVGIVVTPDGGAPLEGRTVDISFAGVCALVDVPVPPQSHVTLAVWLDRGRSKSDQIELHGRVAWCTPTRGRHQLGIALTPSRDPVAIARLEILLQVLSGDLDLGSG